MFISFNSKRNCLLKGIMTLVTLIVFTVFSSLPIQGFPVDKPAEYHESSSHFQHSTPSEAGQTRNDKIPLLLSYSLDKDQDTLQLGWNRDQNPDQRFFIFKKGLQDKEYMFIGGPAGLSGNSFQEKLAENYGTKYVVCQLREHSKLSKDLASTNLLKLGQFEERLKDDKSVYCISNEIVVDINDGVCPRPPSIVGCKRDGKEVSLSWKPGDADIQEYLVYRRELGSGPCWYQFTNSTGITDGAIPNEGGLLYYIWGFDNSGNAGIPLVYYEPGKSGDKERGNSYGEVVPGVYRLTGNATSKIQFQGLSLSIPAGAAPDGSLITVSPLAAGQIPDLPASVPNFTAGEGSTAGYEVTLNGDSTNKFKKAIRISLKYDQAKLRKDTSEKSIFIYYSDETTGKWQQLKRESVDSKNNIISCSVNHFCRFYTGEMTLSTEPPQSKGINTKPNNLDKVNPMAGVSVIHPPEPNNQGIANLSFPIAVPDGFSKQTTPNIAINYNSETAESNCGYGWSLGQSVITIDTKDSLPLYNNNDKLLLDGQPLIYTGNGVYRTKVEGTFAKVVKENGGFVVYYTNGSRMYYGSGSNSQLANAGRVLGWYLNKIVDNFGNTLIYEYTKPDVNSTLYPSKIMYGNTYSVSFTWMDRGDVRSNCKGGFQVQDSKKLSEISIRYNNGSVILKRYKLNYSTGAFGKTLLSSIVERDGTDVADINKTVFSYDTAIGNYFSNTVTWLRPNCTFAPFGEESLRYSSVESTGTQHNEIDFVDFNGDGIPDRVAKHRDNGNFYVQYNTGGGFTNTYVIPVPTVPPLCVSGRGREDLRYTYVDGSKQHTEVDFVDFNGDGLPDRVQKHRDNNYLQVQLNTGNGFKNTVQLALPTTPPFCTVGSPNLRFNWADGGKLHTEIDFIDFNGDGKPDRVNKQRDSSYFRVQYNTGNGFSDTDLISFNNTVPYWYGYQDIRYMYNEATKSHVEIDLVDFNGDGLPDRVAKQRDTAGGLVYVQLNTGHGFTDAVSMPSDSLVYGEQDLRYFYNSSGKHQEVDFVDINGDGLPDRVGKQRETNNFYIDFNSGSGFLPCVQAPVTPFNLSGKESLRYVLNDQNTIVDFVDVNGDGLPDRIAKDKSDNNFYIQFNQLADKNLLKNVTMSSGAQIGLSYQRIYIDPNPGSSKNYMRKNVLASVRLSAPNIPANTAYISYKNGVYDRAEREFRGFGAVRVEIKAETGVTNQNFRIRETTYRVADKTGVKDIYGIHDVYNPYLKGQVDTVTQKISVGGAERILAKEKYEYTTADILSGNQEVKHVYPIQKRVWIYSQNITNPVFLGTDGQNGDLAESIVNEYDLTNGMLTRTTVTAYGDPLYSGDDVKTIISYVKNETAWLGMAGWIEKISCRDNQRISMTTLLYDLGVEGQITSGVPAAKIEWNNNGSDSVLRYEFDQYGNNTKTVSPDGLVTTCQTTYSPGSQYPKIITKTRPDGLTEITRYDSYGQTVETVDTYGDVTQYQYDNLGRIVLIIQSPDTASSPTETITYQKTVDYYLATVKYKDDSADGYISVQYFKDALGREIQIKHEGMVNGQKVWVVSGNNQYDAYGRVIATGSPSIADFSNLAFIKTGMIAPVTYFSYDVLGRKTRTILPSGLTIDNQYDTICEDYTSFAGDMDTYEGRRILSKTSTFDSQGRRQTEYKDMAGKVVRTETFKEYGHYTTIQYDYNLLGVSKMKESTGEIGQKAVDSLGRLMWMVSPDTGKVAYQYDAKGLVTQKTDYGKNLNDGNSRVINYSYDVWNRIKTVDYPGAENDVTYEYYGIGTGISRYDQGSIKMISKGSNYSVLYEYSQFSLAETKTIGGMLYRTNYEYDRQGRIKALTYPDGEIVNYAYDEGGLLKSVAGSSVYIADIQYDVFSQRTSLKYGNGSEMTYTYDPNTRLLDLYTAKSAGGQIFLGMDYSFDPVGNVTRITDTVGGVVKSDQTYRYDLMDQLTSSDGNAQAGAKQYRETYAYDDSGRITGRTYLSGMAETYAYLPGSHAISDIQITNGDNGKTGVHLTYDDFGNMTSRRVLAGATELESASYNYDADHRLVRINNGLIQLDFQYDHLGQRLTKQVTDNAGVIKESVYVNGFYSVTGGRVDKHISDGNLIIASKVGNTVDKIVYYHANHLGSTAALSDQNGQKVQGYLYYPYGGTWVTEDGAASSDIVRLFTGQEYDPESGLYYFNQRYYDPQLGNFLNPDSAKYGLNHYGYANNNPLKYVDPSGNFPFLILAIIGAIVGGTTAAIASAAAGGDFWDVMGAFLSGAAVGAIMTPCCAYIGFQVAVFGFSMMGSVLGFLPGLVICGAGGFLMASSVLAPISIGANMGVGTYRNWWALFSDMTWNIFGSTLGGYAVLKNLYYELDDPDSVRINKEMSRKYGVLIYEFDDDGMLKGDTRGQNWGNVCEIPSEKLLDKHGISQTYYMDTIRHEAIHAAQTRICGPIFPIGYLIVDLILCGGDPKMYNGWGFEGYAADNQDDLDDAYLQFNL